MNTLVNLSFLGAAVLFLGVVQLNLSRPEPPPQVRSGWPLRKFWFSPALRYLALFLGAVAASCGLASAIGIGVKGIAGQTLEGRETIAAVGLSLAGLGAVMLAYSVALNWRPSPREPHGF